MATRILSVLGLALLLIACASTQRMNRLSLGMTKPEVIEAMGDPDISKGANGIEYLIYTLTEIPGAGTQSACGVMGIMTLGMVYASETCNGHDDDYFVQLQEGKVTAYGTVGDFDSTKTPEATLNVNKNIKVTD